MHQTLDKAATQILKFIPFTLACLAPIFFLPFTADFFNLNKLYLITILASVSLLAWSVKNIIRGRLNITLSPTLIPLIILVLAAIISSIWLSPIKHLSLFGQTTLFISLYIIFVTTTASQKNTTVINSVVYGLITSATLLSLFTILHHFGLVGKMINSSLIQSKFFNPTGGVLPALTFTVPVLIATIAYAVIIKNWLSRSIIFFLSTLMIVASIINISLLLPQNGQQIILLLPYRASWSIAVDVLKNWKTAILGTGPETYFSTFTRFRPSYLNLSPELWNLRFSESGSFIMTLLTTTGLVGAVAFLFTFLNTLFAALKLRSKLNDNPSFVFLLTGLIVVLISFVILPSNIVSLTLGFLLLIALTIEFKLQNHESNTKDISINLATKSEPSNIYTDLTHTSSFSPTAIFLPWAVTIGSLALLIFYWIYAIPAYAASATIKQASEVNSTDPVASFLKQVNATKLDPYNPNYPVILSQTYQNVARFYINKKDPTDEDKKNTVEAMQRAIDSGRLAAKLSPLDVNVYENLANIYQSFIGSADGSADYALSHYAQAIALDPTNPKLRLQLGILFFNLGDSDQAFKVISQAIALKQDWDLPYYNIAGIYKNKKDYNRSLQYMKSGYQFTDPESADFTKIQEEIKSLEKLNAAAAATQSATTNL